MNKISSRTWTFLIAGVALLAFVLLAASVNTLKLSPGEAFSFNQLMPRLSTPGSPQNVSNYLVMILRAAIILFWIILPIYVLLLIFSKSARKRLLRDLMILLPVLFLLYLLSTSQNSQKAANELNPRMFNSNPAEGLTQNNAAPPPAFVAPPQWVTILTTAVIALVLTLFVAGLVYVLWRRSQEQMRLREPLRKVQREAQAALDAIEAGGDLREVILRCYYQMVDTAREYRNVYRDRDVTPHEFEALLHKNGLPRDPVHQLTLLFEQVRYGEYKPGRQEERLAIASLSAIVSACQRARA